VVGQFALPALDDDPHNTPIQASRYADNCMDCGSVTVTKAGERQLMTGARNRTGPLTGPVSTPFITMTTRQSHADRLIEAGPSVRRSLFISAPASGRPLRMRDSRYSCFRATCGVKLSPVNDARADGTGTWRPSRVWIGEVEDCSKIASFPVYRSSETSKALNQGANYKKILRLSYIYIRCDNNLR